MLESVRRLRGLAIQSAAWRPGNAEYLLSQTVNRSRNAQAAYTDADHILAAAQWLERAQDATGDDGVSGRYFLNQGWSSSYPETTGYIIPTFLRLSEELSAPHFADRARRCVDFLERVQLSSGAFPGRELHENRTEPSIFNSAQILTGLVAWHRATGEPRALAMAHRVTDWLVSMQDEDGAWRKHSYNDVPVSYTSHASCWVAEMGAHVRSDRYLESAHRHLRWVLSQQDRETGWFRRASWTEQDSARPVTHTIAYTVWGVLHGSLIVGDDEGVAAARQAAAAIARRLELSRRLPGLLDPQWRAAASWTCLTGNAQMALVWLKLHELDGDPRWVNAAVKALDHVKRAQPMTHRDPGIRGGIPGSDPAWGEYLRLALPNWSAKFFIDAMYAKRDAMIRLPSRAPQPWSIPTDVPRALPPAIAAVPRAPLRVVLYTRPGSHKIKQMIDRWSRWGFQPAAVIVERPPVPGPARRLSTMVRDRGFGALRAKLLRQTVAAPTSSAVSRSFDPAPVDVDAYCATHRIPVVHVESIGDAQTVERVRALAPDLAVHAGAGILRAPLLSVPRLGTLNAHMGILPRFRGVNVTEWARFSGAPVGCTVHLVDSGIDTGPILCVREVDPDGAASIQELRARVDDAQIDLLGDVLRWIWEHGTLPPARAQHAAEGRQYFALHAELVALLQSELRQGSVRARQGAPSAHGTVSRSPAIPAAH
jgi:folate-dependent phosphoribosylglycinamide formyltransferase PurN